MEQRLGPGDLFLSRPLARPVIGVLAVQGAFAEHLDVLRRLSVDAREVRTAADMDGLRGLIIPGGESTTISRLLRSSGIQPILLERAGKDLAVFGTCAGMILLCSDADHDVEEKDIELLGLLDATVDRNSFGRQRESFEATLDVDGIGPMPAVFIRAPSLERVGGDVEVLARANDKIVAVQRGKVMATAFHPELTPDTRLHERFAALCA